MSRGVALSVPKFSFIPPETRHFTIRLGGNAGLELDPHSVHRGSSGRSLTLWDDASEGRSALIDPAPVLDIYSDMNVKVVETPASNSQVFARYEVAAKYHGELLQVFDAVIKREAPPVLLIDFLLDDDKTAEIPEGWLSYFRRLCGVS